MVRHLFAVIGLAFIPAMPDAWAEFPRKPHWTLEGHTKAVRLVALDPKGKYVASSEWFSIRLWSLETGKHVHTFFTKPAAVWAMRFTPNGKQLIVASTRKEITNKVKYICELTWWNIDTQRKARNLSFDNGGINQVVFSPDGTLVATGSPSSTGRLVTIRDTLTAKIISEIKVHTFQYMTFSPDNKLLVTGSWTGKLTIWDIKKGLENQTFTFKGGSDSLVALTVLPDSKTLAAANSNFIIFYDMGTGKELIRTKELIGCNNEHCLVFIPKHDRLISGLSGGFLGVNRLTGKIIYTRMGSLGSVEAISVTPDGLWFATANGSDHNATIWKLDE